VKHGILVCGIPVSVWLKFCERKLPVKTVGTERVL
ncbi:unnamed protein product, partial [Allacma fusca]